MGAQIVFFFVTRTALAMAFVPMMILRHSFGRRTVGLRSLLFHGWLGASAVFMLGVVAEVAGSGVSVLTLILWAVGIGFAIYHHNQAKRDLKQGHVEHSRYNGYPWISTWTGINEFAAKALLEPALVLVLALLVSSFDGFAAFWLGVAGVILFAAGIANWIAYKNREYDQADMLIDAGLTQQMEGVQVASNQVQSMTGIGGDAQVDEPPPHQQQATIARPLHVAQPVMLPPPKPKALPPASTAPVVVSQPVRQAEPSSSGSQAARSRTEPLRIRQRPFTVRSGSKRRAETPNAVGFSGPGGIRMRERGTIVNRPCTTVDQIPVPPSSPSLPEPALPTSQQPIAPPPVQSTPKQVPHLARGSSLDPRLLQLMDDDEDDY